MFLSKPACIGAFVNTWRGYHINSGQRAWKEGETMDKLKDMVRAGWTITAKYINDRYQVTARGHYMVRTVQDDHSLEAAINTLYKVLVNL